MKISDAISILAQIDKEFGDLDIQVEDQVVTQVSVEDDGYRKPEDCVVVLSTLDLDLRLKSNYARAWRVDDKAENGHRITHSTRPEEPNPMWFVGLESLSHGHVSHA